MHTRGGVAIVPAHQLCSTNTFLVWRKRKHFNVFKPKEELQWTPGIHGCSVPTEDGIFPYKNEPPYFRPLLIRWDFHAYHFTTGLWPKWCLHHTEAYGQKHSDTPALNDGPLQGCGEAPFCGDEKEALGSHMLLGLPASTQNTQRSQLSVLSSSEWVTIFFPADFDDGLSYTENWECLLSCGLCQGPFHLPVVALLHFMKLDGRFVKERKLLTFVQKLKKWDPKSFAVTLVKKKRAWVPTDEI